MASGGLELKAIEVSRSNGVDDEGNEMEEQPLSPGARLFLQPGFNFYAVAIFSFKTPIKLTIFKQLMSPLLDHPRFSSVLLLQPATSGTAPLGKSKWVPTKVDINDHVIVPTLDTPVGTSPDKVVDDYISGLSKTGMDMSRPMWEWHVLNLKTSDAESTAVLRHHHALGDGVSFMSLFVSLAQQESDSKTLPPAAPFRASHDYSIGSAAGRWLRGVGRQFSVFVNTLISSIMILATLCLNLTDTETHLRRTASATGCNQQRRFVRKTISLDDVKMVKNAADATINDVMIGVVQAGLSLYLNREYGEPKKVTRKINTILNLPLPKSIRLRAIVIVNSRPSRGIPDLAEMMKVKSKVRWGNKIGFAVLPLNTTQKKDPLDHVRESKISMNKKKVSLEPALTYHTATALLNRYPSVVANFAKKTTLALSNMVGPPTEITLFGHQVTNIAPSVYSYGDHPFALVVHVGSYAKKMNIVLSVDERVISDPQQLCDDLKESFDLIKQSVTAKMSC